MYGYGQRSDQHGTDTTYGQLNGWSLQLFGRFSYGNGQRQRRYDSIHGHG